MWLIAENDYFITYLELTLIILQVFVIPAMPLPIITNFFFIHFESLPYIVNEFIKLISFYIYIINFIHALKCELLHTLVVIFAKMTKLRHKTGQKLVKNFT